MLISSALEGKYYYSNSRNLSGIIQYANIRKDICGLDENQYAYAVLVRPTFDSSRPSTFGGDFWSTLFVSADGE